jgi:hypothetical protein
MAAPNSGRGAYNDPSINRDPNGEQWDDKSMRKAQQDARKSGDSERFKRLRDFEKRFMNRGHHDIGKGLIFIFIEWLRRLLNGERN